MKTPEDFKAVTPEVNTIKITKKVVVFCDEGQEDWDKYSKPEFDSHNIVFTNLQVFDSPKAFEETFEILMFDWGGMSLGNSMLDHFIRRLYHMAEDRPNTDFVLLSRFTERAYEDMEKRSPEGLFNIYNVDTWIEKIKAE